MPDVDRTCATCKFWHQWLSTLGDCMEYASRRQDAIARGDGDQFPLIPADSTAPNDGCQKWQRKAA